MMQKGIFCVMACLLLLAGHAPAARVGVVIDLDDDVYTRCLAVPGDTDGYALLEETSLSIAWSFYGESLGHGLCGIEDIGCPSGSCYCDPNNYWNFYVMEEREGDWAYSQVGFDGGSSCDTHYCATDGSMIGLAFGAYGTSPPGYSYSAVCREGDADGDGSIDFDDLVILSAAYGRRGGQSGFDIRADLNGDGVIDYDDLVLLAANYAG